MIAITFAVSQEGSGVIKRLREKKAVLHQGDRLISGKIDNHPLVIVHTGVGRKICGPRMETLLHKTRPRLVISSGFAGAVREDLNVGDLILAENFSDRHLLETAERILRDHRPRAVRLFTSASIVDSVAERNEIARANNAAALDMETETIATACNAHGIPLLSLRVISDSLRQPLPAPPEILFDIERQGTDFGGLALYLMTHPLRIGRFFNFARRVARARGALTDAIMAVIREL